MALGDQVRFLEQSETARVDPAQLNDLFVQLGTAGAESVICRALEELAERLSHTGRCHREGRRDEMRKSARSLIAVAEQLGMRRLAQVAGDVTACIDAGDATALAATLARLLRVGERSLNEVWEMQDLPI